ncbi:MAG: TetR/AcrR family transcriptional regulator [Candidatus Eisenbacteria bacterium]|uniref:TetR/AcrR family transcriptional regulator n=1 Tax=Eiseniibacteriota bacterium TaxID=2212470 RepID=A0A948W6S2_UNCEI|nr:TetR/AcrR family transcriptional regulator [Candidatus Eisenbacteria bacterium]MBU1947285.1 TetR/AcrR family transcriptional regulator [Candidatus Eisenbacteria bacterium]MBU2691824.1 TetR/AcrR family transcriptional regulator [Candidatus Eisenbacteria bacterium]
MPRQAGRSAQQTRAIILDAAAEVLARQGYEAARVDDIARRSGVSKGAFYFHFPSKEEMALGLVDQLSERLIQKVQRMVEPQPPSRARLGAAIQALLETFARKRALGHLLLVNIVGQGRVMDRKFLPIREKFILFIRAELVGAAEAGELPRDLDLDLTARAWLGALHETILHWLLAAHPTPLASQGKALQNLLFYGIGRALPGCDDKETGRGSP